MIQSTACKTQPLNCAVAKMNATMRMSATWNAALPIGLGAALFLSTFAALANGALTDPPLETSLTNPGTGDFPDTGLDNWLVHSFNGETLYEIVDADGAKVLRGSSADTASVLYKKEKIDITKTPWMEWTWRVENTLGPINEKVKAGDDFPGRIYVVVQTGFLPWDSTTVNYVWSSTSEKGSHWESPFTGQSIMVAVEAGDEHLGEWKTERRNVVEDFKKFFNMDITRLDGYAVMVDTDNSDKAATAYFGNISFNAE